MDKETFYAVAIEEDESYHFVGYLHFATIEDAREERDKQDCPEALTILKCEVVE